MSAETAEVLVPLFIDVRISLTSGDVTCRPDTAPDAQERLLLAGLGPLRSASGCGNAGLMLEAVSGARWLVGISEESGLVASVERVPRVPSAPGAEEVR
ncbi:hypothetical protein [Streptomyces sp. NPDC060022]|uniref:hypothetical protein n=1 Tax=Streptomyces sp. NPDC060022 TaxID=3347039 RepID=UPI0036ACAAD7